METIRVNIQDFLNKYGGDKYRHGIFVPEDVWRYVRQCHLRGDVVVEVRSTIIDEIETRKREQEQQDELYNKISDYRLSGYALEKTDISAAIEQFKLCVELGETTSNMFHAYAHAYERIIVLLHKVKDYNSERQYIVAYLKHELSERTRIKFTNRLSKLDK